MTQSLLAPVLPRVPHLSAGLLPLLHQGAQLHLSSFCFFLPVTFAFQETLGSSGRLSFALFLTVHSLRAVCALMAQSRRSPMRGAIRPMTWHGMLAQVGMVGH